MEEQMELTVERMYTLAGDGPLKAFADLKINDAVLVKGFRVVDGKNGLFVGMPRQGAKAKNGKWYDSVVPLTKLVEAQLTRTVLEAYASAETNDKRR